MFHAAMSYLVLARKYRPQSFEQVIGQEHVTRTLQNAIQRGRIHHAFLFCGGRGTGKTTTARILAKALSCVNAPTPEPCNVCPACVEITQGSSVDVQEIDAASQNRVEDIRDLREAIRYAPVRGKKKLYILDEVHMLSTSAFNALLKTLEEPPPHAVFVFATTDPHKLPQTILSRVQRYDFKLVPTSRLVEHLADVLGQEGIEFERSALQLIAREGAGSVRDSLSLLDQVLASAQGRLSEEQTAAVLGVADRGLILGLGRAILMREAGTALGLVAHAYERGFDLVQLARTLLSHLRDLVVVSVVKEPLPLLDVTAGELDELQAQATLAKGRVELLFDRMVRVAEDTSRAALTRYVLEVGLVELCSVEPMQPVGELIDRLEQMEERLAGKVPHPGGRGGAPAQGAGGGRPTSGPAGGMGEGAARTASAAPAPVTQPAVRPIVTPMPGPSAAPAMPGPESGTPRSVAGPRDLAGSPAASTVISAHAANQAAVAQPGSNLAVAQDRALAPTVIEHVAPIIRMTPPAPAPMPEPPSIAPAPPAASPSIASPGAASAVSSSASDAPQPSTASVASSNAPGTSQPSVASAASVSASGASSLSAGSVALASAPSASPTSAGSTASAGTPSATPSGAATATPPAAAARESADPSAALRPISDAEFKQATAKISDDVKTLSFLSHARPMILETNRIVLGHTDFHTKLAQDRAQAIQNAFSAEFKRPMQVEHKLDTQLQEGTSRKSLVEEQEQALQAERARRRREALDHPSRGLVREVFGEVSFLEPTLEPEVNIHV